MGSYFLSAAVGKVVSFGVLAIAVTFVYLVGLVVYRLYFHPLAKFPGLKLNAICPFPTVYFLLRGRWAMQTKLLHDKYGPVVRVSPNELSFNGAQAWEDIYGFRQGRPNMAKDPIHAGAVQAVKGVSSMQYEPDEATHARQKRGLAYSFSAKALLEQEHIIKGYESKLIANIKKLSEEGRTFDICDWLNFLAFDIIGDLAFNEHFECLDRGELHHWVNLVFHAVKGGALTQATRRCATAGSFLQKLLLKLFGDVQAPIREHMVLTRKEVLKRLAETQNEHRDFLWYILQQKEKFEMRQEEIIANSALFILAGSETTSNALSGLLARLLRDPRSYAKLVQEIRSEFKDEDEITHERIVKIPYVNACLNEGLRIHPPLPPGLVRMVPQGGSYIDKYWVPEGVTVSVSSWAASHNPANFRDPDDFIPERWIDQAYASDLKKATQPFSLGPRVCLGKNLAWMELRLTLTRLLWNFDFVSTDGALLWDPEGEMKHMRSFMIWDRPQLNVKATVFQR